MPITVLNPTSQNEVQPLQLAPPLSSLRGCLMGVLDNSKVNSDRIFQRVEKILVEDYGVASWSGGENTTSASLRQPHRSRSFTRATPSTPVTAIEGAAR